MSEKDKQKDDYFQEENPSVLKSIGGLITFSTILPLNIHTSIEEMAKLTWYWPIISGFVSLLGLAIAYLLIDIIHLPILIVAIIIYSFFIIFNGFHHLDGLIDIGDALMVHGTPKKKIAVMRDSIIGTGGIAIFFILATLTIGTINTLLSMGFLSSILICEMSGKVGLVSCCISSKAGADGTGKYFIEAMTIQKYILTLIITLIIAYFLGSFVGVFGVIGGILGGAIIALLGKRNFGIATGDVLGASNEVGRMFSLLLMIIAIIWI